jgi:hypothetical protein
MDLREIAIGRLAAWPLGARWRRLYRPPTGGVSSMFSICADHIPLAFLGVRIILAAVAEL